MSDLLTRAIVLVVLIAGLPLVAALLTGLTSAVLQAATQVQEQTLSFVPRLVVVSILVVLFSPLIYSQLIEFSREVWISIALVRG